MKKYNIGWKSRMAYFNFQGLWNTSLGKDFQLMRGVSCLGNLSHQMIVVGGGGVGGDDTEVPTPMPNRIPLT